MLKPEYTAADIVIQEGMLGPCTRIEYPEDNPKTSLTGQREGVRLGGIKTEIYRSNPDY